MSDTLYDPGFARALALVHERNAGDPETYRILRVTPAPPAVGDCAMSVADFVRYAQQRQRRMIAEVRAPRGAARTQRYER